MKKNLNVLFLFTIFTIVVTWPLILNLNNSIIDKVDGLLITWIINWNIHNFSFNTNIFFPYTNTLAFSEMFFTQSLIALPFVLMFKEPLMAYNINFLLGFVLTGFSVYLLVKYLTSDVKASLLAGIVFTFSTIHLNYMAHLQLFNFWPVVLAVYFLFQKKYKLFVLMFLVSTLTTVLFFYFLVLITVLWGFFDKKSFMYLFFSCLITAPFLIPYYLVSRQFNYQRPITDAIHFSFQIPDLINVGNSSHLYNFVGKLSNDTPGYLGGVFMILAIGLIWNLRKIWGNKKARFFIILAAISFVLSLGPALHIFRNTIHVGPIPAIPLPYLIFYYVVPGFAGMRTPSRWLILMAFALIMSIAILLAKKIDVNKLIILAVLVIFEINLPLPYKKVPSLKEFPPEQVWLKNNYKGAPIVQFPIYGWWDNPGVEVETMREYYSTIHWHPMYNGYSGFSPKEWEERVQWLQKEFPSAETISYLKGKGIKLVLAPKDWKVNLNKIAEFDNTVIYEIY